MNKARIDQLLKDLRRPDLVDRGSGEMLTGVHSVELNRDALRLPGHRIDPGMIKAFGGVAYYLFDDESEKIVLLPNLLLQKRVSSDLLGLIKDLAGAADVSVAGKLTIPTSSRFFEGVGDLSIGGCDTYLQLASSKYFKDEAETLDPFYDEFFDNFSGLPV